MSKDCTCTHTNELGVVNEEKNLLFHQAKHDVKVVGSSSSMSFFQMLGRELLKKRNKPSLLCFVSNVF